MARFPFSVCRPRRSFRPEAAGFRTIPLRRSSGRGTHAVDRLVLAVFNASRPIASLHQDFCDGSGAAAAGHSCPASFSVHVPGPRAAVIAACPGGLVPATLMGFAHALRSIDPIHRRARLSFVSPPRAHVPFRLASTASFIVAGFAARSRQTVGCAAAAPGLSPRMDQPCRATCRPRYSFYAQGRSDSPAKTALSLFFPLSGFHRRPAAFTSEDLAPMGFGATIETPVHRKTGHLRRDPRACPSAY